MTADALPYRASRPTVPDPNQEDHMGIMRKREFREALDTLGLLQTEAAKLLGIDPRTLRRFALGEAEVPRPIALVLRLMVKYKIAPEKAAALME